MSWLKAANHRSNRIAHSAMAAMRGAEKPGLILRGRSWFPKTLAATRSALSFKTDALKRACPRFSLSDHEIAGLVAFIHNQKTQADSQQGGRRGVDVEDLQSGDAEAGKQYFNGAGSVRPATHQTGILPASHSAIKD